MDIHSGPTVALSGGEARMAGRVAPHSRLSVRRHPPIQWMSSSKRSIVAQFASTALSGPGASTAACRLAVPPQEVPVRILKLPPALERIADLLARGLSDKEIAAEADLPHSTVRTYVARIFKKLEKADIDELVENVNALVKNLNRSIEEFEVGKMQRSMVALLEDLRATSETLRADLQNAKVPELTESARSALTPPAGDGRAPVTRRSRQEEPPGRGCSSRS